MGRQAMELMEIILLIAGGIIFILSFFIPDKNPAPNSSVEGVKGLAEEELKTLVNQEINSIREHVDDVVEEAVGYAMEKTERSLERLSNEKIMAVSEYSDTVLKEIHKNHEEAVFLYDMLNNKHVSLKNAVSEVNRTVKEAEETMLNIQKLAPEAAVTEGKVLAANDAPAVASRLEEPRQEKTEGGWPVGVTVTGAGTGSYGAEQPEIKSAKTEREGSERSEARIPEKISFLQDADGQGRNNNERILELFQQGKSTVAIARELGLGVGEVKLVIDLFKSQ